MEERRIIQQIQQILIEAGFRLTDFKVTIQPYRLSEHIMYITLDFYDQNLAGDFLIGLARGEQSFWYALGRKISLLEEGDSSNKDRHTFQHLIQIPMPDRRIFDLLKHDIENTCDSFMIRGNSNRDEKNSCHSKPIVRLLEDEKIMQITIGYKIKSNFQVDFLNSLSKVSELANYIKTLVQPERIECGGILSIALQHSKVEEIERATNTVILCHKENDKDSYDIYGHHLQTVDVCEFGVERAKAWLNHLLNHSVNQIVLHLPCCKDLDQYVRRYASGLASWLDNQRISLQTAEVDGKNGTIRIWATKCTAGNILDGIEKALADCDCDRDFQQEDDEMYCMDGEDEALSCAACLCRICPHMSTVSLQVLKVLIQVN